MFEYRTESHLVAYPFRDDARFIVDGTFPKGIIVDALFSIPYTANVIFGWKDIVAGQLSLDNYISDGQGNVTFNIHNCSGNNCSLEPVVSILCENILNTTTTYFIAKGTSEAGITGVLVINVALLKDLVAQHATLYFGSGLLFLASVHDFNAKRVANLRVFPCWDFAVCSGDPFIINEDILLRAGNNIGLTHVGTDGDTELIRIDAAPGLGLGQIPCHDVAVETNPIGVTGDITITGDDCYNIVTKPNGNIEIHSRCTPCCDCADYASVVARQGMLAARLEELKNNLATMADKYNEYVTAHDTFRGINSVLVSLVAVPGLPAIPSESGWAFAPASEEFIRVTLSIDNVDTSLITLNYVTFKLYNDDIPPFTTTVPLAQASAPVWRRIMTPRSGYPAPQRETAIAILAGGEGAHYTANSTATEFTINFNYGTFSSLYAVSKGRNALLNIVLKKPSKAANMTHITATVNYFVGTFVPGGGFPESSGAIATAYFN